MRGISTLRCKRRILGAVHSLESPLTQSYHDFIAQELVLTGVRKPWFVVLPSSPISLLWVALACLLATAVAIIIPYELTLSLSTSDSVRTFVLTTDAFSASMVLLSCVTAVKGREGMSVVLRPKQIVSRYASTWAGVDVIAALPLDALTGWPQIGMLRLLRLRYFALAQQQIAITSPMRYIAKGLSALLSVCLPMHWGALIWGAVCRHGDATTLSTSGFDFSADSCDYTCLLYVVMSMLLGENWAVQGSQAQNLTATAIMLFGALLFALLFGEIIVMLSQLRASTAAYQEKMRSVNESMRVHQVNPALKSRVLRFYEFRWMLERGIERDWTSELPEELRSDIAVSRYANLLRKVPIFASCSERVIVLLSERLKPKVTMGGDAICKQGNVGKEMYLIEYGIVTIWAAHSTTDSCRDSTHQDLANEKMVGVLTVGDFFGELALLASTDSFLGSARRRCTVRARTTCLLQVLSSDDLEAVAADEPKVMSQIVAVAAKRLAEIGEEQRIGRVHSEVTNSAEVFSSDEEVRRAHLSPVRLRSPFGRHRKSAAKVGVAQPQAERGSCLRRVMAAKTGRKDSGQDDFTARSPRLVVLPGANQRRVRERP